MTIDDYLSTFSDLGWRLDQISSTTRPGQFLVRILPIVENGDQINTCQRTIHMALADALNRLQRNEVYNPGRRIVTGDPDCGPITIAPMVDLSALIPSFRRR